MGYCLTYPVLASFDDSSATQKAASKIWSATAVLEWIRLGYGLIEGSAKRKSTNQLSEIVDHLGRYPKELKVDVVGTRFLSQGKSFLEPPEIEMSLPIGILSDLIGVFTTG
jgi:hypothetical protein